MFALVDCNNFFASCEMVFNPKFEQKPLVILSNNDGCIVARSPKAKALGVKMGDPAYLYRNRSDLLMLSANFALYSDMSHRVMQTIATFTPDLEIYSIDETFLTLPDPRLASTIRQKVKQWTGIPVSIGIAPTKTLAKLASETAKKEPSGTFEMPPDPLPFLSATPLDEIWGIGTRLAEQLKRRGVYTAAQLAQTDDRLIQKWLGITGFRTVLELRGTPCFELDEIPEKKKSIICSRSFGRKIEDLTLIQEAVASFAAHAAEKLREQASLASFLSLFLATHQESWTCHAQLPNPTAYTPNLIALAKDCARRAYRTGIAYKKAGVMLGDFTDEDAVQSDLFSPTLSPGKKAQAMEVLDSINARYDKQALRFAAEGVERTWTGWKGKKANSTPKFTTSWDELLLVK